MFSQKKRLNFFFTLLIIFTAAYTFIGFVPASADEKPELVFYNWTAYVGEGIVENFEKTRNCTIRQEYFQSSDERDENVMRKGGKGYDIIMINGNDVTPYSRQNWIRPIGTNKVPSLVHMDKRWVEAWPDTKQYAVPYLWGTVGIVYRSDLIGEDISSWMQFYQPKEAWRGKIMVLDIHRLGIGLALKGLGYSINSENPEAMDAAIDI